MAFSPDGSQLLGASNDHSAQRWPVAAPSMIFATGSCDLTAEVPGPTSTARGQVGTTTRCQSPRLATKCRLHRRLNELGENGRENPAEAEQAPRQG